MFHFWPHIKKILTTIDLYRKISIFRTRDSFVTYKSSTVFSIFPRIEEELELNSDLDLK